MTRNRLPNDFVEAAWKQYTNAKNSPLYRGRDRIALVTRGHHPTFQAIWTDIKITCTSVEPALSLARIQDSDKQWTIFNNIRKVINKSSTTVQDEEILEFIRHLQVIPRISTLILLKIMKPRFHSVGEYLRVEHRMKLGHCGSLWLAVLASRVSAVAQLICHSFGTSYAANSGLLTTRIFSLGGGYLGITHKRISTKSKQACLPAIPYYNLKAEMTSYMRYQIILLLSFMVTRKW